MPAPVLLDTDIGDDVDDAFALLLAARQPAVQLLGVTTVYGPVQERGLIARKLLDLAGQTEVPVAIGLGQTLAGRDPGRVLASGQGYVEMAAWDHLAARLHPQPAVDFLIETIMAATEPPTLVAIGPLTNVGAALRREPRLARHLRALILMGGRLGEHAALGEHNFNSDPEAAQIVLASGAPLRIGTYEVTSQARIGHAERDRLRGSGDAACAGVAAMLDRYLREQRRQATAMYDPATLTLSYAADFLTMRRGHITVTCTDDRTQLHFDAAGLPNGEVSVAIAAECFISHLMEVLTT